MGISKRERTSAFTSCVFLLMAMYSSEHILEERSLERESCIEWDTRGVLSMGTLFLGHVSTNGTTFGTADNSAAFAG